MTFAGENPQTACRNSYQIDFRYSWVGTLPLSLLVKETIKLS